MDPFVRRLIQRLQDARQPLSRNRHFHTFDTPEGKLALKTARRLKSLQRDLLACHEEGGFAQVQQRERPEDRIELRIQRPRGSRTSFLSRAELELLTQLPGVREALARAQSD
jgi:hypothetical protein